MPPAMQKVVDFMPLTQGIKLLKGASLGLPFDDIIIPVAVMAIISIICITVSLKFFKWE
jgi:ABC-2 type transport system permease protein